MLISTVLSVVKGDSSGGFEAPSISNFFPDAILFAGTPFAINRLMLVRIFVVVVLILLLWLGTRNMRVARPSRGQVAFEYLMGFVRNGIVRDTLGNEVGRRYEPILMTMFFLVLGMNLTEVVPGIMLPGTAAIGLPLVLALVSWVMFMYAGMKEKGWRFWKDSLFIPGVPWYLYFLLTPLEFISTFIVRPVTLTLRLMMNMVGGNMLLALCFSATQFFLFTVLAQGNLLGLLSVGSFAFGIVFLCLEIFVSVLQAYVFAILSAIYIQLAVADEH